MEATLRKRTTHPVSHYCGKAKEQKATLPQPNTIEELHQMVAEGERQFAEGLWQDSEDMFRELEEDFAREGQRVAEAV